MSYSYLEMESYKRKAHFDYFSSLAYPYVGMTADVEITKLLEKVRVEHLPLFLTMCYCVSRAANGIPEFRQRILNSQIIEFDSCKTSHTVALEDGTYCYCTLDSDMPFPRFLPYASHEQKTAKENATIREEETDTLEQIFLSTLPWISYTSLIQPVPIPADSNPRITWGKYFSREGRMWIPVSLLCHHGLVDGIHLAQFYHFLDEQILTLCQHQFQ